MQEHRLGVVMDFPRAASTVLCAGTQPPRCDWDILLSTWQPGPDPQNTAPNSFTFLAAGREMGILPMVERKKGMGM